MSNPTHINATSSFKIDRRVHTCGDRVEVA
jgi:hypothetical protein